MTPKPTSVADAPPVRVLILTLDKHIVGAVERARAELSAELPGLSLSVHAATQFSDPQRLAACCADIEKADLLFVNMLFLDEHIQAVLPTLQARRDHCDAMVCAMSAGEVMRLTRMGDFRMDGSTKGPLALLRKLRGRSKSGGKDGGSGQMAMLRLMPRLLRFIPGKAQDLRAYFLTLAYWLSGSSDNIANLVRMLVHRYAAGPRQALRTALSPQPPREYPEVGLYHPRLPGRITRDLAALPSPAQPVGTVGLLIMRSYVLSGDSAHYDAVIHQLESRGLRVIAAFASGLDARPAIDQFFYQRGQVAIDALLSLTGFSLVGGPAFNDTQAAEAALVKLDVPYVAVQPLEFQSIEEWRASSQGLTPVEATIMVAIPELDGATGPMVFAGRPGLSAPGAGTPMQGIDDRVSLLAARIERLIQLRKTAVGQRNLAIVLFNFPPNGGATGTAAYLSVFASLHNTLRALKAQGYSVEVPASVEDLRQRVLAGNAARYGSDANVVARIATDVHVRREPFLREIEAQWGKAPGTHNSDGSSILVMGAQLGRVLIAIQPTFGYEGDPMRLLFDSSFAPTHAFSAFYRYLREDFAAHAVLHFGTHGALEFMPGKQVGLSASCWPERLLGALPNIYLYAANNPSEGALARRRSSATLVSYLTPPLTQAGLYRGLQGLRESLDHLRALSPQDPTADRILPLIHSQAVALDLLADDVVWSGPNDPRIHALRQAVCELEQTLIPCGLHVVGEPMSAPTRIDYLQAMADAALGSAPPRPAIEALVAGQGAKRALALAGLAGEERAVSLFAELARCAELLAEDQELPALMRALDARFVRPAPGGDLLRNSAVLPTGRNLHGFDPFSMPTAFAVLDGAEQAERLLTRHVREGLPFPQAVAIVLWGADNLKSGGGPIGQALSLLGARPRLDSYGRLCGAELIPLAELGRPRIDVLVTLSGIFRDLLPLQTRLLSEAAYLAASADEPESQNYVRAHARAYQAQTGCSIETAALRVFSNCDGAYGANVNQLIDSGAWQDEDELAEAYTQRKCFAYGRSGPPSPQPALLKSLLANLDLAYQNLESVELGVTSLDHYFDTLGGIGRAARRAGDQAKPLPIYIGDQTAHDGKVRTLSEQVALESRTRALNPKWAEEMLKHGAEGVRHIECHVTNTLGWSATTGQVAPWVYRELSQTYVLDPAMRDRLAQLNPKAALKLANRLIEATDRNYWQPDAETLSALRHAGEEIEDRMEGLGTSIAA